uniref:Uncharacterized protein n=1 Tax=Molossus molossus TaxID=27622 RepID=A0A7J8CS29_MOLMO|nr:hypothetical protein HJG59_009835 [Molossus molossus]
MSLSLPTLCVEINGKIPQVRIKKKRFFSEIQVWFLWWRNMSFPTHSSLFTQEVSLTVCGTRPSAPRTRAWFLKTNTRRPAPVHARRHPVNQGPGPPRPPSHEAQGCCGKAELMRRAELWGGAVMHFPLGLLLRSSFLKP